MPSDPKFGKPPRAAPRWIAAHASGDGRGRATTDDDNGSGDEDDEAVLCDEDSLADMDADDVAASNSGHESLQCAESAGMALAAPERPTNKKQLKPHGVECGFLLAARVCDLTSPFLLAGIHGSSVAQEAPSEEVPQTSSGDDEVVSVEKLQERADSLSFDC